MTRKIAVAFVFALALQNCSTEKVNLSPVSDVISGNLSDSPDINFKTETISYQSEITNLISSFPKFNNSAIDKEVGNLKLSLIDFLEAITEKNISRQEKAFNNYVKTYKKIQKLRKYLNKDKDDVLNRYLVRIKTNVNLLKSIN